MKKLLAFGSLGLLLTVNMGCSGSSAQADDKELRKQFGKEKFDINDVPQNQRAMVQGYIDRAKNMSGPSKAASSGK
jgi:hypothetical protein